MRRNHGTTKKRLIIAVAFLLAMIACTVAFAEGEEAGSNLYGTFWSLLPPIIAIGLALITKEVYTSLFVGIVVGCVLQNIFRQVGCEQNQDPCGRAACNGCAWLLDFH